MRISIFATPLLLVGLQSLAVAQTVFPFNSLDTTESTSYAYQPGAYSNGHHQWAFGDHTGKGAIKMSELSLRRDGSVSSSTMVARSWSNVTVTLGETSLSSMTTNFSNNHLTTPTMVFSGSQNWPDLTTVPSTKPAPWDQGGLKFPFSTTHVYTGTNDMLFDFTFTGGTLANNGAWSGSTGKYTYLDGRSIVTSQQGSLYVYGLNSACTYDSSYTGSSTLGGGYGYEVVYSYTQPTNRFSYKAYYTNMPNSTPFFQALSLNGTSSTTSPGPVPGLGCQALQLDLSQMLLLQSFTTTSSGYYSQPTQYTPFIPGAVGVNIWAQGAWDDTGNKSTHLTRTSRCIIPALPPKPDFNGKRVYRYDAVSTTGFGPYETNIPVIRVK